MCIIWDGHLRATYVTVGKVLQPLNIICTYSAHAMYITLRGEKLNYINRWAPDETVAMDDF